MNSLFVQLLIAFQFVSSNILSKQSHDYKYYAQSMRSSDLQLDV